MDNSSRNIVTFIFVITVAALLIMGARYYAQSQKDVPTPVADAPPLPAAKVAEPEQAPTVSENETAAEPEVVIEDIGLITGEPTIALDGEYNAGYPAPAPAPDAVAAPGTAPPAAPPSTGE